MDEDRKQTDLEEDEAVESASGGGGGEVGAERGGEAVPVHGVQLHGHLGRSEGRGRRHG